MEAPGVLQEAPRRVRGLAPHKDLDRRAGAVESRGGEGLEDAIVGVLDGVSTMCFVESPPIAM